MAAFKLNLSDLQFVLRQIKISEANSTAHAGAAAMALTEIYVDAAGNPVPAGTPGAFLAIPDPHVPFGLRTVDGRDNNIVPGREEWGAADTPMPRLFEPSYINDADGDQMPFGGGQVITNTDYGVTNGAPAPTNGGHTGNVADADPRIISNLIVDMSIKNPAAILAALTFAGSEDPMTDLQAILALDITLGEAADALAAAQADLGAANTALDVAVQNYIANANTLPVEDLIDAIQDAAEAVTAAEAVVAEAQQAALDPQAAMIALAQEKGIVFENGSIVVPNVAPDEGLSAPFNAWMTFFGQFFDHGLDLISKGGNGTIYVPLASDDPLVLGTDGELGTADDLPAHLRFMALTRSTTVTNADGEPSQRNVTTGFVDQNQTYTSHASHQVFLREYTLVEGRPVATGRLLDGADGGLATWADVKAQARNLLGIELTDMDVFAVPLLRTDAYGEFIRDANGFPQLILGVGSDGIPNTADDITTSGTPTAPVNTFTASVTVGPTTFTGAIRTNNAFLDDIAHSAVPALTVDHDRNPATAPVEVTPDADEETGNAIPLNEFGVATSYDNELLDRHYITGDGRGNENIGLTAVHHIFHSEHNRQIESQKLTILQSGDLEFVNEWFAVDIDQATLDAFITGYNDAANKGEFLATKPSLFQTGAWDGERLFQAARVATEMQYQHLVFEEFGRKIQPLIDPFVFNSITDVDPSIFAEFANVVYRFGHSMLTESMPRVGADGNSLDQDLGLIEAFLNPVLFDEYENALGETVSISHDEGAAAVVRGMTIERGNEIDEFVTGALRNNLLGLPLDLAAINIARGRDTGTPTLNEARQQLFDASGSTFLTPYTSWTEFAANLKNPISVVNFIAAYGQHATITSATTLEAKRDAAWALVFGSAGAPGDRLEFLNSTGSWTAANSGLNSIDFWIGGLAEKKMPFGGMLGSTFNAVFELQMENLQDGDRFYYLTRTQGQNFLNALEQNSFAKMIMANTSLAQPGPDGIRGTADDIVSRHIGVDSFAVYDYVLEVDAANQADYNGAEPGVDPEGNDPTLEALGLTKVLRDDPNTAGTDANYLRVFGGEHVVVGGTAGNDTIITDFGDDGIWGDAGDDRIESGAGVDLVNGGAGNDIITDSGDTGDFIKGDEGDDVIANSNGIDILMGGDGKDVVFVGVDATEVFGGQGDDFILGGDDMDFLLGNEGDDWIEGGGGFDTTAGDNSELFFNSAIKGHDVMFAGEDEHDFDAESGDDIMVQGESVIRNEGMFGFDWAIYKGVSFGANADMRIPIFTTEQEDILRNRFDKTEALSGWNHNDTLIGDDRVFGDIAPGDTVATTEGIFFNDGLDQEGINRIDGLSQIVAVGDTGFFESGNILLGGAGSDVLEGNGGDDILDGDRWLNVRISIRANPDGTGQEIATVDSLKHVFAAGETDTEGQAIPAAWIGKSLFDLLLTRTVVPGQMQIVREILTDGVSSSDEDIAVFNDVRANYTITHNDDGTVTVTHNTVSDVIDPETERNLVSDGVDTLRNIEIIRFSDQDYLVNRPATGVPLLSDLTPTQDEQISVNLAQIADDNGIANAAFAIRWQALVAGVWTDIVGATTSTFTPTAAEVNLSLRVVVDFTDDAGAAEQVISAPTDTVGLHFVGNILANVASGTAGSDRLEGNGGSDILNGLAGADVLLGGGGSDELNGGLGNDSLDGGGGGDTLNGNEGEDILNGNNGSDVLNGGADADTLSGGAGRDQLNGDAGADNLSGGAGNDTVDGGDDDDTITWSVGDGRDIVRGGTEGTIGDTIVINGNASDETFRVYTRAAWDAVPGNNVNNLQGDTEIVITRNGTGFGSVITELAEIEEIVINTGDGTDTVIEVGDFSPTNLSQSTLTINGGEGDDSVDITGLLSAHRILFRSNGGHDTIVGNIRPQDVIELATGQDIASYSLTTNVNGTKTFSNGVHSITFTGAVPPQFQNGPGSGSGVTLDDEDLQDLRDMVQNGLVRDSSGLGNNVDNPTWGTAGHQFIRLTDPHYTDGATGIRSTDLTPREISDIISNQDNDGNGQEESIPNAFGGTSLLTFFGQYFDHGLDFVAKGQPGNVAIGSDSFPINAPRSNIVPGTGVDPDGVPNSGDEIPAQYINNASPYVDQNQAYGSHNEITNLLRKWEAGSNGQPQQTAYLLTGDADETGRALLPTLSDIRENYRIMTGGDEITVGDISNYRGTGQSLLIDFIPVFDAQGQLDLDAIGHYFVTGDGRANENVMLTSIHTVWARNHNFWVDKIKAETNGTWTEAEYFEAARMMNIAEYQRVVFTEFATAMAGGLDNDDEHGFEGYDPAVDASISVEFAQAAYRFGHSMLNETVSFVDSNGALQQVSLVEAFLRPDVVANGGVNGLLAGSVQVEHQAIDVDVVNALRNQLVGRPLDLAALNIFRGRDMGIAPFNSVRAQLYEQTGLASLRPYAGWDDFQQRNGLSNQLIDQVKLAYSGNFAAIDLWVGGLLEKPRAGQLGTTFGYIFLEQLDRLQNGDRFYYLEIFDDSLFTGENDVTFADIIERTTGLTGLPSNVFDLNASNAPADDDDSIFNPDPDQEDDDNSVGNDDDAGDDDNQDDDDASGDDDDTGGDNNDDDDDDDDDDDEATVPPPPATTLPHVVYLGTPGADVYVGTAGDDFLSGGAGDDSLFGFAGDDSLTGGSGNDTLIGDAGSDLLLGDSGDDRILAGTGDDRVFGGAGQDTIFGDDGDDVIFGDGGDDAIEGGNGNDTFFASVGDGNDTYSGGAGIDTLDMTAIMANLDVNLLTGIVSSTQSGTDGVTGVEVVKGGAGNDTITVGFGTTVVDGGAGNDTFVFTNAETANVTIEGFNPGDKIDLRPLFQSLQLGSGGDDFTLISSGAFSAAGQIKIETVDNDTFVQGNTDDNPDNDFSIKIADRPFSASDFA